MKQSRRSIVYKLPKGVKPGEIHNGRVWTIHPTKGVRSVAVNARHRIDESKLHPLAQFFRLLGRRKGVAA